MKTITMSMEMFERITDSMVCEYCPMANHNNSLCAEYKSCGDAIKVLIEKEKLNKPIEK